MKFTKHNSAAGLAITARGAILVLLALPAALFLAWQILARADFLYPLWYEVIGIEQTIATYGPRSRHRRGFETTTKEERVRLFSAMAAAIHHQGEGLAALTYHDPAGRPIATLLTPPEIVHLQDVARLMDILMPVGWGALLALALWLIWLRFGHLTLPPAGRMLLCTAAVIAVSGAAILLIGPVEVFYALHTRVFPPEHPWFFYYEDSLMTMLMKAPVLFGYIAAVLLALTLALFSALLFAAKRITG